MFILYNEKRFCLDKNSKNIIYEADIIQQERERKKVNHEYH